MKVSVIMSVFNESMDYVSCAIESIECQTFQDFELIIILDNPQNGEILDFLRKEQEKYCNIVLLINKTNIGLALSLNRGIKHAVGEYIARMDADDYSYPERLQKEVTFLDKNPSVSIVATSRYNMDETGKVMSLATSVPKSYEDLLKQIKYENVILHPSVMFRKADIENMGGYRNFPASQDIDLWLRCIEKGLIIRHIDEPLLRYRRSNTNVTGSKPLKQWLCNRYIRKLCKERRKRGTDSYSYKNMMSYLEKNGYGDRSEEQAFKQGMNYFILSRKKLKEHNIGSFFTYLIRSFFQQRQMPGVIWAAFHYQRLARR